MSDSATGGSAPGQHGPALTPTITNPVSLGSGGAMMGLVDEHHALLFRYAYRLTGSCDDAEDLTQQTFLTAQRSLAQLRDATRAKSWLCTILRHSYLRTLRRRRVAGVALADFDLDLVSDDEPPADPFAMFDFDRRDLQEALDELPVDFKLVLLMFYFEDCSYREIAARLGLPIGTVMSRLARAKQRLRQRLEGATV